MKYILTWSAIKTKTNTKKGKRLKYRPGLNITPKYKIKPKKYKRLEYDYTSLTWSQNKIKITRTKTKGSAPQNQ